MKKYRAGLLLSVIGTVFLFVSCGIPNYYYNSTAKFTSNLSDGTFTFRMQDTDNDGSLSKLDDGVGLYLLYYLSDSNSSSEYSKFTSSLWKTSYTGTEQIGISKGNYDFENPVLYYVNETDDIEYGLYPFSIISATQTDLQSPPYFAFLLDKTNVDSGYLKYYFKLGMDSSGYITLTVSTDNVFDSSDEVITLGRNFRTDNSFITEYDTLNTDESRDYQTVDNSSEYYIHVFAAISAQKGSFNNAFWSSLYKVGTLKVVF